MLIKPWIISSGGGAQNTEGSKLCYPRLVEMFWLFESVGPSSVVDYGSNRELTEYVVNGEVVLMEKVRSDHRGGRASAKEVANCFLLDITILTDA